MRERQVGLVDAEIELLDRLLEGHHALAVDGNGGSAADWWALYEQVVRLMRRGGQGPRLGQGRVLLLTVVCGAWNFGLGLWVGLVVGGGRWMEVSASDWILAGSLAVGIIAVIVVTLICERGT